jgi:hypothetical protein
MYSWPLIIPIFIIVGLAIAYYFFTPLLILKTQRMNEDFDILPWNPLETPPPDSISRLFQENENLLIEAGFRGMGSYLLPNSTPNTQAVVRFYVHHENRDAALATAMFGILDDGSLATQAYCIEFVSRFASDNLKVVQTNNSFMTSCFARLPEELTFRFPDIQDSSKLYRLHQALVRVHAPIERKILTVIEKYGDDAIKYLANEVLLDAYRKQEGTGFLRHSPAERCWRATIKGAYLMTWKLLWPIKQIRLAQMRRRAFQLERELELP